MVRTKIRPLPQRRTGLHVYKNRRHIPMAHNRQPQRLNTVISMHTVRDGAGAEVVWDLRDIGVLCVIYGDGSVVAGLEPGVLPDAV